MKLIVKNMPKLLGQIKKIFTFLFTLSKRISPIILIFIILKFVYDILVNIHNTFTTNDYEFAVLIISSISIYQLIYQPIKKILDIKIAELPEEEIRALNQNKLLDEKFKEIEDLY